MAIFGHGNAIKCKNNGTTSGVMLLTLLLVAFVDIVQTGWLGIRVRAISSQPGHLGGAVKTVDMKSMSRTVPAQFSQQSIFICCDYRRCLPVLIVFDYDT